MSKSQLDTRLAARRPRPESVTLGLVILLAASVVSSAQPRADGSQAPQTRTVRPLWQTWTDPGFDPEESAGIFIGVQSFEDKQFLEIPYAVDDAIDLAHVFAVELSLVTPRHMSLLISGKPQNPQANVRLEVLKNLGVHNGLRWRRRAGLGNQPMWPRSLGPDPTSVITEKLSDAIGRSEGRAVLMAARPGGHAYDDDERQNGVFTGALLDALHCVGNKDPQRLVTIQAISNYVNDEVVKWIKANRSAYSSEPGIEAVLGGSVSELPLAACPGKGNHEISEPLLHFVWMDLSSRPPQQR